MDEQIIIDPKNGEFQVERYIVNEGWCLEKTCRSFKAAKKIADKFDDARVLVVLYVSEL